MVIEGGTETPCVLGMMEIYVILIVSTITDIVDVKVLSLKALVTCLYFSCNDNFTEIQLKNISIRGLFNVLPFIEIF